MIKSGKIQEITRHFGHRKPEQLYLAIGNGTSTLNKVIKHIVPEVQKTTNPYQHLYQSLSLQNHFASID